MPLSHRGRQNHSLPVRFMNSHQSFKHAGRLSVFLAQFGQFMIYLVLKNLIIKIMLIADRHHYATAGAGAGRGARFAYARIALRNIRLGNDKLIELYRCGN